MPSKLKAEGKWITIRGGRHIFITPKGRGKTGISDSGEEGKLEGLAKTVSGKEVSSSSLSAEQKGIEDSYIKEYEDGTKVLWKESKQGSADSEVMTYELSKELGLDIVPETTKVGSKASAQKWIEDASTYAENGYDIDEDGPPDPKVALLDALTGNPDRHTGNLLLDEGSDKTWAIDNDHAFGGTTEREDFLDVRPRDHFVDLDPPFLRDVAQLTQTKVVKWKGSESYNQYVADLEKTFGKEVSDKFKVNVDEQIAWADTILKGR